MTHPDLAAVARRARVSEAYLKAILSGSRRCPYNLACRLSQILQQPLDSFVNPTRKGDSTPRYRACGLDAN